MRPRALLADDSDVVTAALSETLDADGRIDVVATVTTGAEALVLCRRLRPDIAVLDLDMPGSGPDLVRTLASLTPPPQVLIFSGRDEPDAVLAVLRSGATCFVAKGSIAGSFADLMMRCAAGEMFVNASCADEVLLRLSSDPPGPAARP